jgi:cytochrome c-type biogenesis protein CcmE
MPDKALKILLTTGILCAAFVGLLWTTMQDGTQYYLEVEEVVADPATWDDKPLQVHGYAANVMRRPKSLDYRFEITESVGGRTHVLNAVYNGIVPDTFDNHAEVVATGRLDGDTLYIDADGIMAKCPSKYEEKPAVAGDYVSGAGSAASN